MDVEMKRKASDLLRRRFAEQRDRVYDIEPRLGEYLRSLAEDEEMHNAYEILGGVKFLRLLRTYETDVETFDDVIYKYEGIWEQRGGLWYHVEGGLKHPGNSGPTYYRLQPFQVFVLACMFLLKVWINTESEEGSRLLLPTEEVREVEE